MGLGSGKERSGVMPVSTPDGVRKGSSGVLPVHVAVGGEGLATHRALVGPLPAVHQHVTVQGAGRAQGLPADAAGVIRRSVIRVVLRRAGRERVSHTHVPPQMT